MMSVGATSARYIIVLPSQQGGGPSGSPISWCGAWSRRGRESAEIWMRS